ncbi:hypothetical protein [Streptomyces griseorubiginosus]|uniref:Uncharacterized protein n=1 Tax=Streptomyces griseorubiginosus TaxID=67304 RepID=A0AAI8PLS6_9ACTN|nr:hypothetical protein [Streptomyces griseorubiginosus]AYC38583.1 hypothetical protein DWG14_02813 [Streptomyces griseorubiginosus]
MAADNAASVPEDLIVSVLSAVVVSVLGVANLWFQEWRARRNAEARRRRLLDEARAYLGFLTEWLDAHAVITPGTSIDSVQAQAATVLDQQLRNIHASFAEARVPQRTPLWAQFRRLLLLYPLRSIAGSLVRLLFYLVVIIVFSVTPGLLLDDRNAWGDRIGASGVLIVAGGGLLYGLWRLANRLSPQARVLSHSEGGAAL